MARTTSRAPRIIWTVDAARVHRATLSDGRRLWAWRSEPGCWHYGLTHPGHLGDVANFYICNTPAQARADALAMAGHLRVTCRPIRAMRLGTLRDGYNVHPVSGEGADQHNTQRVPFGPVAPLPLALSCRIEVMREEAVAGIASFPLLPGKLYRARIADGWFSGSFDFETRDAAVAYLREQSQRRGGRHSWQNGFRPVGGTDNPVCLDFPACYLASADGTVETLAECGAVETFGPPMPPEADLVQQARVAHVQRLGLAAAVAEPADPAMETGDAYADRQMAAYGVEPTRWTTDALQDAHAHLTAAGNYPDHMAAIGAELVARDVPDAAVLVICAEMERRRQEWTRLWDLTPEGGPDTDADRAFNTYGETVWPRCPDLVGRLIELRAVTPAGVRAKAAAAFAMAENGFHDGPDNEFEFRMATLRDAALLAVG